MKKLVAVALLSLAGLVHSAEMCDDFRCGLLAKDCRVLLVESPTCTSTCPVCPTCATATKDPPKRARKVHTSTTLVRQSRSTPPAARAGCPKE